MSCGVKTGQLRICDAICRSLASSSDAPCSTGRNKGTCGGIGKRQDLCSAQQPIGRHIRVPEEDVGQGCTHFRRSREGKIGRGERREGLYLDGPRTVGGCLPGVRRRYDRTIGESRECQHLAWRSVAPHPSGRHTAAPRVRRREHHVRSKHTLIRPPRRATAARCDRCSASNEGKAREAGHGDLDCQDPVFNSWLAAQLNLSLFSPFLACSSAGDSLRAAGPPRYGHCYGVHAGTGL